MNLLPREEKFYHSLNQQVTYISEAAELLYEGARTGNAKMVSNAVKIKDLEQRGDEVIHVLLDVMYAKAPYTVITHAMHIHPTVAEFIPSLLGDLAPLSAESASDRT